MLRVARERGEEIDDGLSTLPVGEVLQKFEVTSIA